MATPFGFATLLARPESNPKLAKGGKVGVLSSPLHLAPASLSGFNVCPMASRGCIAACLHTAGNPAYMAGKARARMARTKLYFENREMFLGLLVAEVAKLQRQAERKGMLPAVRLNATSDIPWERVPVRVDGATLPHIMAAFPKVEFYDYTKRHNRDVSSIPNYSLTFSLAEDNDSRAAEAFNNGMNVATVFAIKRNHALPKYFNLGGALIPVIDGDLHDFRPIDPAGSIVALRAKGKAIGDTSGFVRQPDYSLGVSVE